MSEPLEDGVVGRAGISQELGKVERFLAASVEAETDGGPQHAGFPDFRRAAFDRCLVRPALALGCRDGRRFRFHEGPVKRVAETDEAGEVAFVDPVPEQFSLGVTENLGHSFRRYDPIHQLAAKDALLQEAFQHNRTVLVTLQG